MAPKAKRKKPGGKKKQRAQTADFANRPFAEIKAKVPAVEDKPESVQEPGPRHQKQPEDDESIFALAMNGVTPLGKRQKFIPPQPPIANRPSSLEQEEQQVMDQLRKLVDGQSWFSIHETDEAIEGLADGVDPRLLSRLKSGEFSIQDHLDLHGLSRQQARPRVEAFLSRALGHGMRCVLIIHGRGHRSKDKKPVLKPALKNWFLRSGLRKSILAFCTARVCDGGAGAIYVLLKKAKRP